MPIRSIPRNFRQRGGLDTEVWNRMMRDLEEDIQDVIGSGAQPFETMDLGLEDFLEDHEVAVSGLLSKL